MNSIPLIKGNTPQEINTSIIALKKALSELEAQDRLLQGTDKDVQDKIKQINELIKGINTHLGTVDSHLTTIDDQITALQPVDTVTSGNMQSVTSNAVANYSAPKVRNKNQLADFTVPSNWGIEVNEQQYPSTAIDTWQPMLNVKYEQDGKNSSLGFFQNNLTFVKNNAEQFYVVLCPLSEGKPIEIKHSILRKTTNASGTFILTNERPIYARCTNIVDAMCIVGSYSATINWVKVCNYDFTPLANTDVELDLYYI